MKWLRDEDFIRGTIPMTKFDIRALTLTMLDINCGDILLDVGAGTGSVSIQAALLGALAFLARSVIIHWLGKDVENFKTTVNANAQRMLEEFKAQLA